MNQYKLNKQADTRRRSTSGEAQQSHLGPQGGWKNGAGRTPEAQKGARRTPTHPQKHPQGLGVPKAPEAGTRPSGQTLLGVIMAHFFSTPKKQPQKHSKDGCFKKK